MQLLNVTVIRCFSKIETSVWDQLFLFIVLTSDIPPPLLSLFLSIPSCWLPPITIMKMLLMNLMVLP